MSVFQIRTHTTIHQFTSSASSSSSTNMHTEPPSSSLPSSPSTSTPPSFSTLPPIIASIGSGATWGTPCPNSFVRVPSPNHLNTPPTALFPPRSLLPIHLLQTSDNQLLRHTITHHHNRPPLPSTTTPHRQITSFSSSTPKQH